MVGFGAHHVQGHGIGGYVTRDGYEHGFNHIFSDGGVGGIICAPDNTNDSASPRGSSDSLSMPGQSLLEMGVSVCRVSIGPNSHLPQHALNSLRHPSNTPCSSCLHQSGLHEGVGRVER